mmetsp:Transcript_90969/g.256964  ORF Transcript_90969/g.256964 Transcript_90969/m.256964 type:complete len:339 (-) Transcript_90969:812-1828(-)
MAILGDASLGHHREAPDRDHIFPHHLSGATLLHEEVQRLELHVPHRLVDAGLPGTVTDVDARSNTDEQLQGLDFAGGSGQHERRFLRRVSGPCVWVKPLSAAAHAQQLLHRVYVPLLDGAMEVITPRVQEKRTPEAIVDDPRHEKDDEQYPAPVRPRRGVGEDMEVHVAGYDKHEKLQETERLDRVTDFPRGRPKAGTIDEAGHVAQHDGHSDEAVDNSAFFLGRVQAQDRHAQREVYGDQAQCCELAGAVGVFAHKRHEANDGGYAQEYLCDSVDHMHQRVQAESSFHASAVAPQCGMESCRHLRRDADVHVDDSKANSHERHESCDSEEDPFFVRR